MNKPETTKQREKREWKDIATNFKQSASNVLLFAKRLFGTLIGLSILALGVYGIKEGLDATTTFRQTAFLVCGGCAAVDGLYIMYCALVKIK